MLFHFRSNNKWVKGKVWDNFDSELNGLHLSHLPLYDDNDDILRWKFNEKTSVLNK